ncbi:30S ribosomal protein S21 [Calditrichota bacterium]
MIIVNVDKNIPFDRTLRLFSLKCRRANIFRLMHEKSFFVSPSEKRHRRKSKKTKKILEK